MLPFLRFEETEPVYSFLARGKHTGKYIKAEALKFRRYSVVV